MRHYLISTITVLILVSIPTILFAAPESVSAGETSWIFKGGWMMVPLISCSIIGVGFIFERLVAVRSELIAPVDFIKNLHSLLKDNSLEEAVQLRFPRALPTNHESGVGL